MSHGNALKINQVRAGLLFHEHQIAFKKPKIDSVKRPHRWHWERVKEILFFVYFTSHSASKFLYRCWHGKCFSVFKEAQHRASWWIEWIFKSATFSFFLCCHWIIFRLVELRPCFSSYVVGISTSCSLIIDVIWCCGGGCKKRSFDRVKSACFKCVLYFTFCQIPKWWNSSSMPRRTRWDDGDERKELFNPNFNRHLHKKSQNDGKIRFSRACTMKNTHTTGFNSLRSSHPRTASPLHW